MIDLHSHLLPAVDDGSRSVEQSVGVLAEMASLGVTDICLTPHLLASQADAGVPQRHDAAFAALRAAAPSAPALHRGAEVMLDRPLSAAAGSDRRLCLGGTRYILVEFPRMIAFGTVSNALRHVAALGLVPLLAHPERYSCCTVGAVQRWRDAGALMQVDATTILSPRARGERARQLLAAGLAHILAADNHGDDRTVAAARDALLEHQGFAQADLLLVQNPGAILADGLVETVPPLTMRTSFTQRLRRLFEGDDA
jgi:protein-tyrosine phosphatase